jgi:hypothetical protein
MSLPERKHKQHDYPENPYCPACIEEARDKEWAQWIINHFAIKSDYSVLIKVPDEEYEALKKLIEG